MQTCRKIVNWRQYLRFPAEVAVPPLAKDLICRLLCDVEHRLGTNGAAEIKVMGLHWRVFSRKIVNYTAGRRPHPPPAVRRGAPWQHQRRSRDQGDGGLLAGSFLGFRIGELLLQPAHGAAEIMVGALAEPGRSQNRACMHRDQRRVATC